MSYAATLCRVTFSNVEIALQRYFRGERALWAGGSCQYMCAYVHHGIIRSSNNISPRINILLLLLLLHYYIIYDKQQYYIVLFPMFNHLLLN